MATLLRCSTPFSAALPVASVPHSFHPTHLTTALPDFVAALPGFTTAIAAPSPNACDAGTLWPQRPAPPHSHLQAQRRPEVTRGVHRHRPAATPHPTAG
eukprot:1146717-Pelagomonas_calceolata.AAC.3